MIVFTCAVCIVQCVHRAVCAMQGGMQSLQKNVMTISKSASRHAVLGHTTLERYSNTNTLHSLNSSING